MRRQGPLGAAGEFCAECASRYRPFQRREGLGRGLCPWGFRAFRRAAENWLEMSVFLLEMRAEGIADGLNP